MTGDMRVERFSEIRSAIALGTLLSLALLGFSSPSAGSQRLPPALQPTGYASPSGEFVLFVDPTNRLGKGPGNYTLSRDGVEVWASEHPITLWSAVVADDGWVAGYAYTAGYSAPEGEFVVASLSPAGELVLNDVIQRHWSRTMHAVPDPTAAGLFLDLSSDRFVVRVRDSHSPTVEDSWTYRLAGSDRLDVVAPEEHLDPPRVRALEPAKKAPAEYPELELTPVSSIVLGDSGSSSGGPGPIRRFGFEAGGRLRIVRAGEEQNVFTVSVSTRGGRVLRVVEIGPIGTADISLEWWPLVDGRWLVTETRYGPGAASSSWFADEPTGTVTPLLTDKPSSFDSVAAVPDGGFVALVTFRRKYTRSNALYRVSAAGQVLWKIGSDSEDEAKLFSPAAVAVTPQGRVAVVDNIRKRIQLFDLAGSYTGKLELEDVLSAEPNYPTGITVDPIGAVLLHDFGGEFPLYRIRADGEVFASIRITPPEGRPLGRMHHRARIAPDGSMWTTDGHALHRVDDKGFVDRTVGAMPVLNVLNAMGPACIDRAGRILIQDRETALLHAFDGAGERLFIARPAPGDFDRQSSISKIFVDRDGTIFVQSRGRMRPVIQFSPEGERLGPAEFGSKEFAFGPDGSLWLGVSSSDQVGVRRMKDGETLADVQKTPSGRWFGFGGLADFDTDSRGELIVLHSPLLSRPNFDYGLGFYDSEGSPRGWVPLSGRRLAVSDEWVVVWDFRGTVLLVRRADDVVFKFTPPGGQDGSRWHFGFSAAGDELWAIESAGPTLHKFALP